MHGAHASAIYGEHRITSPSRTACAEKVGTPSANIGCVRTAETRHDSSAQNESRSVDGCSGVLRAGHGRRIGLLSEPCEQTVLAFEKHYSIEELSVLWGMSEDFVRRLFRNEPGVVVFANPQPGKRTYRTLRVLESVACRVHERMTATESQAHTALMRSSKRSRRAFTKCA